MKNDIWQYLKKAQKPIVLYGMGNGADKIINVMESFGIPLKGVFATDEFVRNKTFHGFNLTDYTSLKEKYGEMIVLVSFGSSRPQVFESISRIANEQEIYAPDVPVYGNSLFTEKFYSENEEQFKKVYSQLADDISRTTFNNVIDFKLSGKIEYLTDCQVDSAEPYQSILSLKNDESFIDLGAYNGDTVAEFISHVKNYSEITAVEPDVKNFKKLIKNTENYENIRCVNACISDRNGTEFFSMKRGRGSAFSDKGQQIPCFTVDKLLDGKKATYIKIDVEGEELKAISGMANTIKEFKPKLQISCYHRTEDLISIPSAVNTIRSDYKLYIRHFPYIPAWDTNFYFI